MSTNAVRTVGVLEVKAMLNQKERSVIIDTGACVSCIDESLLTDRRREIRPVHGLNLKTATEQPVTIIGRTDIILQIGYCIIGFEVFVARGVGDCCILGNDFHLEFGTEINFARRSVSFTNRSGRRVTVKFHNQEKEAKYLRPPPDPTWLNQIQIDEVRSPTIEVRCAGPVDVPPRSFRLLKITYTSAPPNVGVIEPKHSLFQEKSILVPRCLTNDPPLEELVVMNLSEETVGLEQGEVLGEVDEVKETQDLKSQEPERVAVRALVLGETKLNLNPDLTMEQRDKLIRLLTEYADRFAWDRSQIGKTNVCELEIPLLDSTPVHQPPYRVSHREREIIRSQVDQMLQKNVIRPSRSQYASPVVLVKKKEGEWRFCVDYRKLNEKVVSNQYPLPLIDDILTYLNGCKWFCTLDMNSGYWQIPVREEDKHKTAFITPDGLWEFQVTPFGLKTSPAVFQRCMDQILAGLKWGSCLVYLDDVLIMAADYEEMLQRLRLILERLREASMTLNPSKCAFGYQEVKILGHIVDEAGIRPDPAKIESVTNFETPRRVRAVRSFLGLCNYYRKFVPDFSKIAAPLTQLTRKDTRFNWGPKQEEAFRMLKEKLTTSPILKHFNPKLPLEIHTDASDLGVGAALMQQDGDTMFPIAFSSRKLSDAERKYCTTEKECIAVVWAVQHFRHFLWGRPFTIVVDHHALCWLDKNKDVSGRLGRWALKLMEFDYKVRHKQGRLHVVPDCLSRNACQEFCEADEEKTNDIPMLALEVTDLERLQDEDEECKRIKDAVNDPENALSHYRRAVKSYVLTDGLLYRRNVAHLGNDKLLVVPKSIRNEILYECHDSPLTGGHLGFSKTFTKIKSRYYWPNMLKEVEKYVKSCADCQTRKSPKLAPEGLLQPITVGLPMDRIGIDFLGPFTKTSRQKCYKL
jgi:hypothetical protein